MMKQIGLLFFILSLISCNHHNIKDKVFYINSYHEGYKSSDDIKKGFDEVIGNRDDVEVEVFYMDTKQIEEDQIQEKVDQVLEKIDSFQPDVIVTSDDNAVKYVIEPYFIGKSIPILFTGVNWTCDQHGLPTSHIKGMLEVLPVEACVDTLKNYYPEARKLAILSENSTSEQNNIRTLTPLFESRGMVVTYLLADTYKDWKIAFDSLNDTHDLIFLPTNGSIKGWDVTDATAFVKEKIKVPVFTCDDFMMQYAAFGFTKIPQEMGEWAAHRAIEILEGRSISEIKVTKNKSYEAWINPLLSGKIEFEPSTKLREALKEY